MSKDTTIVVRCTVADRAAWQALADGEKRKLADWARNTLNLWAAGHPAPPPTKRLPAPAPAAYNGTEIGHGRSHKEILADVDAIERGRARLPALPPIEPDEAPATPQAPQPKRLGWANRPEPVKGDANEE